MEKNKDSNNSINSLVFGLRPQPIISFIRQSPLSFSFARDKVWHTPAYQKPQTSPQTSPEVTVIDNKTPIQIKVRRATRFIGNPANVIFWRKFTLSCHQQQSSLEGKIQS